MHHCGLYPPARKRILLFNGLQVGESIHRRRHHAPPDLPGGVTSLFESSEKSRALPEHSAPATRYSPTRQDGQRDCHETRAIDSGPGVSGKIDPQLPTLSDCHVFRVVRRPGECPGHKSAGRNRGTESTAGKKSETRDPVPVREPRHAPPQNSKSDDFSGLLPRNRFRRDTGEAWQPWCS